MLLLFTLSACAGPPLGPEGYTPEGIASNQLLDDASSGMITGVPEAQDNPGEALVLARSIQIEGNIVDWETAGALVADAATDTWIIDDGLPQAACHASDDLSRYGFVCDGESMYGMARTLF